jgi:hypothetical protein
MATVIEFVPSVSPFTGLNTPTQQVYSLPSGWASANYVSARVPMAEDGAQPGRYYASVDETISSSWLIYVSSSTPSYWNYVAIATIPPSSSAGTGARVVTITVRAPDASPVQGATVRLSRTGESYSATTNVSGVAVLNVNDATWTVSITAVGFTFTPVSLVVANNVSQTYTLTLNSQVLPSPFDGMCNVLFSVLYLGQPLVGANVSAILEDENPTVSQYLLSRQITTGVTDGSGNCVLAMVQYSRFTRGGKYRIKVADTSGRTIHDRRVTVPTLSSCNAVDLPDG